MASLNFEDEKVVFGTFYSDNKDTLNAALDKFVGLLKSALEEFALFSPPQGRIKKYEECISKFRRKYKSKLEEANTPYEIKNHITDLLGIRIVCLYEDEVEKVIERVRQHFEVLGETNKMKEVKTQENHLGYQAWHLDVRLSPERRAPQFIEYKLCRDFQFELQVRTLIQDAWSTLDHKMQYKKTLPIPIKRRINVLSALFELADKEFVEIRKEIELLSENAKETIEQIPSVESGQNSSTRLYPATAPEVIRLLESKYPKYQFFPDRVENLLVEILKCEPSLSFIQFQSWFNEYIDEIELYRNHLDASKIPPPTPLTIVRHIFYRLDNHKFAPLLSSSQKENFSRWFTKKKQP
jgi:ppGpp synthetase/RelA/SpoT-type nucleotidyltranferase